MKKEIWIPKTEVYAEMFNDSKKVYVKAEMDFELKQIEEKRIGFYNDKSSN